MKNYIKSVIFFLLIILLTGCSTDSTSQVTNVTKTENKVEVSKVKEKVKIWVLVPISWAAAVYWEDALNAYRLVIDKVNKAWWINWAEIELVIEDSKCNWKDAVWAVQKLINLDNVQVIIWPLCSVATVPAWKIAQTKKIPLISPTASASNVWEIWDYIRRYWNDDNATRVVAEFANKKGFKKLAIIAENTDYGVWYTEWFEKIFEWDVTFMEKYNPEEKDFSIIAKKIIENKNNIDSILLIPNSDSNAVWILKSLDSEWILDEYKWKMFGSEVVFTDWVKKVMSDKIEWLYTASLSQIDELDDKSVQFLEKYKLNHEVKSDPLFVILEAESMELILDAIAEVWIDSQRLQDYLLTLDSSNKRNWIFWKYYFEWSEAVWLKFLVKQFKNWELELVK